MYDSECAGAVKRNRASLLDLREAGAAPDACILLESARRRREADYCSSFILTTRRIFFSLFFEHSRSPAAPLPSPARGGRPRLHLALLHPVEEDVILPRLRHGILPTLAPVV